MVNTPPFDRDPPPPGGFDPRFGGGRGPGPRPAQAYDPRFDAPPPPRAPYDREADPFGRGGPAPVRRGLSRGTMVVIGLGLLLLLGAIAFALSLSWTGPGGDALDGDSRSGTSANETAAADPAKRCAAPATYDKIKRELFRQAATARGVDPQMFDRLAGFAAVRVSGPVLREQDAGLERVSCEGQVALDLPPGVQVAGGRRSLTGRLGYTLQPAADGSGDVVTLSGANALTASLATLGRTPSATAPQPVPVPVPVPDVIPEGTTVADPRPPEAVDPPPPATVPTPPAPRPAPAPAPTASASPSFSCARASNRTERAICGSGELASLDRQMASRFFSARGDANPTQRVLLDRTRNSFLAFRNRCGNDQCIADAYRGRIREIGDIMADRWVAPR